MPRGTSKASADAVGDDGEAGGGLGADAVGLAEGDVAVVLDDEAVQAARDQRLGVAQAGVEDRGHAGAAVARGAGERRHVDHADSALPRPKISPTALAGVVGNQRHARGSMRVHVIGNAAFDETLAVGGMAGARGVDPLPAARRRAGRQGAEPGGGAGAGRGGRAAGRRASARTRAARRSGRRWRREPLGLGAGRRCRAGRRTLDRAERAGRGQLQHHDDRVRRRRCAARTCAAALAGAAAGDVLLVQGNLSEAATRAALEAADARGMVRVMNPSPLRPWQAGLLADCEAVFVNARRGGGADRRRGAAARVLHAAGRGARWC